MVKKILFLLLSLIFVFSCSELTDPEDDFTEYKDPGAIRIGLVNDVNSSATVSRLGSLAANTLKQDSLGITEFTITEISSDITTDSLKYFTIIYLPVSWASAVGSTYENINANAEAYMDYVDKGGALFIEQPNPFQRPQNTITIDFLQYPITLSNGYLNEEVTVIDPNHYITKGLDGIDLPFPGDQVEDLPAEYTILAQGSTSAAPSLFYINQEKGKLLFAMGHPSPTAVHPYYVEAYFRMLLWLTLDD